MTALLLEPHQDDVALFCAFNAIRHKAHVVTLLRDGGGNAQEREYENEAAMAILGCQLTQWISDSAADPSWDNIRVRLGELERGLLPDLVFAPYPEPGGHEQHNRIGELAREIFGDRVVFYTTYVYGGPKTRPTKQNRAVEVPFEQPWIARKLRALACYTSQIERGPYRFFLEDLREYEVRP